MDPQCSQSDLSILAGCPDFQNNIFRGSCHERSPFQNLDPVLLLAANADPAHRSSGKATAISGKRWKGCQVADRGTQKLGWFSHDFQLTTHWQQHWEQFSFLLHPIIVLLSHYCQQINSFGYRYKHGLRGAHWNIWMLRIHTMLNWRLGMVALIDSFSSWGEPIDLTTGTQEPRCLEKKHRDDKSDKIPSLQPVCVWQYAGLPDLPGIVCAWLWGDLTVMPQNPHLPPRVPDITPSSQSNKLVSNMS